MSDLAVEFSKKLHRLKRLSDFYFQILDEVSVDRIVISDLQYLFVSPKNHDFCNFCFEGRYFSFINQQHFILGKAPQKLVDKDWETKVKDNFLADVYSCLEKHSSQNENQWALFNLEDNEFVGSFSIVPYEICNACNKREYTKIVDEAKGEALLAAFMKKMHGLKTGNFQEKLDGLSKFLLEDSFGFVSYFNVFNEAGFEDKSLEEGLDANSVATLLSFMPPSYDPIMCGGQDQDASKAQVKAMMEFVERYALKNKPIKSPIISGGSGDIADIEPFLELFDPKIIEDDTKEKLNSSVVWGVDLITNSKKLLPLGCLYSLGKVPFIKPTSNGFAAHFDAIKAIESATFELIERDAFMRFWIRPETAKAVLLSKEQEESLNKIVGTLGKAIGNDSLQARAVTLESPVNLPVVLAFITSKDLSMPPAILIGSSCEYSIDDAINGAFAELRVAILNLIAQYQKDPNWLEKGLGKNDVSSPDSHMYFYHYPEVIPKMKFLEHLLSTTDVVDSWDGPENIDELRTEFESKGIQWYVIDATPIVFEEYGVFVPRCFIPQFYPLQFGEVVFNLDEISYLSCAKELPHCFS